jgi:hypothetical protein
MVKQEEKDEGEDREGGEGRRRRGGGKKERVQTLMSASRKARIVSGTWSWSLSSIAKTPSTTRSLSIVSTEN